MNLPQRRTRPRMGVRESDVIRCPSHLAEIRRLECAVKWSPGANCLGNPEAHHVREGQNAGMGIKPAMFWAYDPGDEFETLQRAARLMIAAGFTAASHRLRVYVLIGFPKDTFDLAEKRLNQMMGIGLTPMAMLWSPDKPSQERYRPAPEWRAFQRRWARPAIIHSAGMAL